jgi:hypothetical protein
MEGTFHLLPDDRGHFRSIGRARERQKCSARRISSQVSPSPQRPGRTRPSAIADEGPGPRPGSGELPSEHAPSGFRNLHASHRNRGVSARQQFLLDPRPGCTQVFLRFLRAHPVDRRGPLFSGARFHAAVAFFSSTIQSRETFLLKHLPLSVRESEAPFPSLVLPFGGVTPSGPSARLVFPSPTIASADFPLRVCRPHRPFRREARSPPKLTKTFLPCGRRTCIAFFGFLRTLRNRALSSDARRHVFDFCSSAGILPSASFGFPVAGNTLALGQRFPIPRPAETIHLLVFAHAGRTQANKGDPKGPPCLLTRP